VRRAAGEAGTCARACSLVVLEEGPGHGVPCEAGVDGCPETCRDEDGIVGHCTAQPGLPEGVGACVLPTGGLACASTVDGRTTGAP